jgi:hypothetical protein
MREGKMDPAALGVAVASLMAKKALEATGKGAGEAGWDLLVGLANRVRNWLGKDSDAVRTLEVVEQYPDSERAVRQLAAHIEEAALADPRGAATVEAQLAHIEHVGDRQVASFVNQVRDHASVGRIIQVTGDYSEARYYDAGDQEDRG